MAIVWGLGIATAIYLTGSLSGAHLNPSVTLAMAVWNGFPWRRVLPYFAAQLLGAFVASAVLYGIFGGALRLYEKTNGIVRGAEGSEATAMVFGDITRTLAASRSRRWPVNGWAGPPPLAPKWWPPAFWCWSFSAASMSETKRGRSS